MIYRVLRRLRCLLTDHRWDGYGQQPLGWITCRRCGVTP